MKKEFLCVAAAMVLHGVAIAANPAVGNCGNGKNVGNASCDKGTTNGSGSGSGQGTGSVPSNPAPPAASSTSVSGATGGNAASTATGGSATSGSSIRNSGNSSNRNTITNRNSIRNTNVNANRNSNWNTNTSTGGSSSVGNVAGGTVAGSGNSTATGGTITGSGNSAASGGQGGSVSNVVEAQRRSAASAIAPIVVPTAPCVAGSSFAIQLPGGGISGGGGNSATYCVTSEVAKTAFTMGDRETAEEIMCGNQEYAAARKRIGRLCSADKQAAANPAEPRDPYVRKRLGLPALAE